MRRLLIGISLALSGSPVAAQVTSYPTKPIRIVVASSPGGGLDIVARGVGQQLTAAWGQSVVIDNRSGASGTIGAELVARAAPDGYTLLIVSASYAVNPSVYPKLPYDSIRDFAPIIQATTQPQVLAVHPSVAARSLKEFVALAKAAPGRLNYSSPGDGSLSQLAFELFKRTAGLEIQHIPYKGAGLSTTALASGEVQVSSASAVSMLPHVKSGRIRPLASTGTRRVPALPDVPTMTEQGYPGATISGWYAFFAPARTPRVIIDRLNAELARILQSPHMHEQLAREGSEPAPGTPEQLARHLAAEIARLGALVKGQ
jgi:tripartite-type tricarboxylate transporter receptor subunit TctC